MVFIFFPGSWGGKKNAADAYWFALTWGWITNVFAPGMERDGWRITPLFVEPKGATVDAYTQSALNTIAHVKDRCAIAVCYSAGTDLARRVAMERPRLFRGALFLGGLPPGGLGWNPFLRGAYAGFLPFARGFFTGGVDIVGHNCVETFFGKPEGINDALVPEPTRVLLAHTPLRFLVGVTTPRALPCKVVSLVGASDFFVHLKDRFPGEQVTHILVDGGTHAMPLEKAVLEKGLGDAYIHLLSFFAPASS